MPTLYEYWPRHTLLVLALLFIGALFLFLPVGRDFLRRRKPSPKATALDGSFSRRTRDSCPAPVSSTFPSKEGILYYQTAGSPTRPALLLLHGIASSSFCWRYNIPTLSQHFYVLAPDLLGFGQSAKSLKPGFSFATHSKVLLDWLDFLSVTRSHIMGCSMGGALGLWLARNHPSRFLKIVAIAPAASPKVVPSWISALPPLQTLGHSLINNKTMGSWALRRIMSKVYSDKRLIAPEFLQVYRAPYKEKGAHSALNLHLKLMGSSQLFESLKGMQTETLMIRGEKDRIISKKIFEEVAQQMTSVCTVTLPNAGHHPMEETPEAFHSHVLPFLNVT